MTNRAMSGPPQAEWDPNGYKNGAWDSMNKAKRYPRKAQVLGLEGKCVVKIMLHHDGSLAARPSIIGKGTGHDVLDEECIAMAERVKFPPIPDKVEAPVTFRFPIEFHLENR
jgi:protein TonB